MEFRDAGSSLFWLGVALLICLGSVRLSLGDIRHPGPGFFPFLTGALLGALSLQLFLFSRKKGSEKKSRAFWPNSFGLRRMIWTLIALLLYVIGMKYVGFFFATILFLGFLLKGIGGKKWTSVFLISLLTAIIAYAIFQYWLDVQLPRGFVGF